MGMMKIFGGFSTKKNGHSAIASGGGAQTLVPEPVAVVEPEAIPAKPPQPQDQMLKLGLSEEKVEETPNAQAVTKDEEGILKIFSEEAEEHTSTTDLAETLEPVDIRSLAQECRSLANSLASLRNVYR